MIRDLPAWCAYHDLPKSVCRARHYDHPIGFDWGTVAVIFTVMVVLVFLAWLSTGTP